MKKLLAVILSIALLALAGCGTSQNVDVTIPALFSEYGFTHPDMDFDAYAQEQGFVSAGMNDDGSTTITMTKAKHQEFVSEMQKNLDETFDSIVDDVDIDYIESIDHNSNYTVFDVSVDREGYDSSFFDLTPFTIGVHAMLYQSFTNDDLNATINMIYSDTGEVFSTTIYPEALED